MQSGTLKKFLLILILCLFSFNLAPSHGDDDPAKIEENRAKLLSYMLVNNLGKHHFSRKKIDDDLSKAAFKVYLKQLDPQKRYFIKEDIDKLSAFAEKIDDEMKAGSIQLPVRASELMGQRLPLIRDMIREILSQEFDFNGNETIETDIDKLEFCSSLPELRERWQKTLKYQVMHRYLTLLEDEKALQKDEQSDNKKPAKSEKELIATAREKILKTYETIFARLIQEKSRDRYDRYFESFSKAFDPHTDYLPPTDKEDFDIGMKGQLEGIGATLKEEDGYVKVVSIVPGGPAYRQGSLQPEDTILKVREGKNEPVEITDMKLRDAIKHIRGKKGTEVTLTIKKPGGALASITLIRDVVQLEEGFVKGMLLKDDQLGKNFGYIRIPTFYRDFEKTRFGGNGRNSTDDVRKEMKKLESSKIEGLILDLRNNGGGALTDSVKTAGLFIKDGPVVQVKGLDGKVSVLSDDDADIAYEGPIIVLVNKFSASASEILAGALQDYGRAVIIGGEHTHGKGTVQTIVDLNDEMPFQNMDYLKPLGALKLTTQKFYRITGASTQYRGITPDIILPDRFTGLKSGEQHLDYALPWDTINAATYSKWKNPVERTSALKEKSLQRVRTKKDFLEIEGFSKIVTDEQKKTIKSLNIETARKELEETRAMREKENKGPHGKHGNGKKSSGPMTEDEKKEFWNKEVREDAYVLEAVSVLLDLIADQKALTLK
ncbi:MAG: tail-specific protease [Thermodesulfovibrio sp.]|nr:tail-specific protease [Thermodesulfovibrio sp.]